MIMGVDAIMVLYRCSLKGMVLGFAMRLLLLLLLLLQNIVRNASISSFHHCSQYSMEFL